jgi:hypothetical protein
MADLGIDGRIILNWSSARNGNLEVPVYSYFSKAKQRNTNKNEKR